MIFSAQGVLQCWIMLRLLRKTFITPFSGLSQIELAEWRENTSAKIFHFFFQGRSLFTALVHSCNGPLWFLMNKYFMPTCQIIIDRLSIYTMNLLHEYLSWNIYCNLSQLSPYWIGNAKNYLQFCSSLIFQGCVPNFSKAFPRWSLKSTHTHIQLISFCQFFWQRFFFQARKFQ